MALRDTFGAAVVTILDAFEDLIPDIEYYDVTPGVYDPVTNSATDTETLISIRGAFYKEKQESKDWSRVVEDSTKILIAGDELLITPEEHDYMIIDSVRYEIIRIDPIGDDVAYIFRVRAP